MIYKHTKSIGKGIASAGESALGAALGLVLVWWTREYLHRPMDVLEASAAVALASAVVSYASAHARNWWKHCGKGFESDVEQRRRG